MNAIDRKLFPGCWFLEHRAKPDGNFALLSRDNDDEVMRLRYDYQAERLKVGQTVRLYRPDGTVAAEKTLDNAPAPATLPG